MLENHTVYIDTLHMSTSLLHNILMLLQPFYIRYKSLCHLTHFWCIDSRKRHEKAVCITVLILVILCTVEELNDCANLQEETCALCLIKPGCAWCSDEVCKVSIKQNNCIFSNTIIL